MSEPNAYTSILVDVNDLAELEELGELIRRYTGPPTQLIPDDQHQIFRVAFLDDTAQRGSDLGRQRMLREAEAQLAVRQLTYTLRPE